MADPPGESAPSFPAPRRSELRLRAQALLLLETAEKTTVGGDLALRPCAIIGFEVVKHACCIRQSKMVGKTISRLLRNRAPRAWLW